MSTVDDAVRRVPADFYIHNPQRGETLHYSHPDSIRREVTDLRVAEGTRVLEIGTGTGYSGALLAALTGPAGHVTSIDISEHLVGWANLLYEQHGVTGVSCLLADGTTGYPAHAPYDRIVAWCAFPRLPRAWVDQLTPTGRIVACLPITAQPSTTLVATITLDAGRPQVETITFGGYAQSTPAAVEDALTVPGRWVDWSTRSPVASWISIGWRADDDRLRTGARTALDRLLNPGHIEIYENGELDWQSWNVYTAVTGGRHRSVVSLHGQARGIGHSTATSAAVILTDGTILADRPDSPSLTELNHWLNRWETAGRPAAAHYTATLTPVDGDGAPGWELRAHARIPTSRQDKSARRRLPA